MIAEQIIKLITDRKTNMPNGNSTDTTNTNSNANAQSEPIHIVKLQNFISYNKAFFIEIHSFVEVKYPNLKAILPADLFGALGEFHKHFASINISCCFSFTQLDDISLVNTDNFDKILADIFEIFNTELTSKIFKENIKAITLIANLYEEFIAFIKRIEKDNSINIDVSTEVNPAITQQAQFKNKADLITYLQDIAYQPIQWLKTSVEETKEIISIARQSNSLSQLQKIAEETNTAIQSCQQHIHAFNELIKNEKTFFEYIKNFVEIIVPFLEERIGLLPQDMQTIFNEIIAPYQQLNASGFIFAYLAGQNIELNNFDTNVDLLQKAVFANAFKTNCESIKQIKINQVRFKSIISFITENSDCVFFRDQNQWPAEAEGVKNFLKSDNSCHGNLISFLDSIAIKPIQRAAQYPLTIAEIIKHTPDQLKAKQTLRAIEGQVKNNAGYINKTSNKAKKLTLFISPDRRSKELKDSSTSEIAKQPTLLLNPGLAFLIYNVLRITDFYRLTILGQEMAQGITVKLKRNKKQEEIYSSIALDAAKAYFQIYTQAVNIGAQLESKVKHYLGNSELEKDIFYHLLQALLTTFNSQRYNLVQTPALAQLWSALIKAVPSFDINNPDTQQYLQEAENYIQKHVIQQVSVHFLNYDKAVTQRITPTSFFKQHAVICIEQSLTTLYVCSLEQRQAIIMSKDETANLWQYLIEYIRDKGQFRGKSTRALQEGSLGKTLEGTINYLDKIKPQDAKSAREQLLVLNKQDLPKTNSTTSALFKKHKHNFIANTLRVIDYYLNNELGKEIASLNDIEQNDKKQRWKEEAERLGQYASQLYLANSDTIVKDLIEKISQIVHEIRSHWVIGKRSRLANTLAQLANSYITDQDKKLQIISNLPDKQLPADVIQPDLAPQASEDYIQKHIINQVYEHFQDYETEVSKRWFNYTSQTKINASIAINADLNKLLNMDFNERQQTISNNIPAAQTQPGPIQLHQYLINIFKDHTHVTGGFNPIYGEGSFQVAHAKVAVYLGKIAPKINNKTQNIYKEMIAITPTCMSLRS
jgi:predicted DNA-binding protein YlxM (UPF0122 family)